MTSDPLQRLATLASGYHEILAGLLDAMLDLREWDDHDAVLGLNAGDHLALVKLLTPTLVRQLETVAPRATAVPLCTKLYRRKVLTFDQLAQFVALTASYNGDLLARLDREAAQLADQLADVHQSGDWTLQTELLVERRPAGSPGPAGGHPP